jgi:hypothetical protein
MLIFSRLLSDFWRFCFSRILEKHPEATLAAYSGPGRGINSVYGIRRFRKDTGQGRRWRQGL